jgi:curved DNA-binding protein CbpA
MNPYEMLGLEEGCTDEEITVAFRALAKEHHPDVGGDPEIFIQINIAVDVLRDPYKRRMFDEFGVCMGFSEDNTKQMALGKFRELVSQWIDVQVQNNQDINIQKFFRDKIAEARGKLNHLSNNCELAITALKERKEEVKVVDGERNIVHEMMQFKIDQLITNLQTFKMELSSLEFIEEESKKYSSMEEMQTGMMSSSSSTNSSYLQFVQFR